MGLVFLAAYPAKRCPIRVHWDHSPHWLRPELSEQQKRLAASGAQFEGAVFAELKRRLAGSSTTIADIADVPRDESAEMTIRAMEAGTDIILGGDLGKIRGRTGRPDLLVRCGVGDARARYLPVDVKEHGHLGKPGKNAARVSRLDAPFWEDSFDHPDLGERAPADRFEDVIQLAHYTQMLMDLDRHPDELFAGGIIGTTGRQAGVEDPSALMVAWHRLDEKKHRSTSRSAPSGHTTRSAMERYAHEFAFRHTVASDTRANPQASPDASIAWLAEQRDIAPSRIAECAECHYYDERCAPLMTPHASQQLVVGSLGPRTWRSLSKFRVRTIEEMAGLDVDDFLAETKTAGWLIDHTDNPAKLGAAKARAELIVQDRAWQWLDDSFTFPRAHTEIDVDFEYDTNGTVCYLITARVRIAGEPQPPRVFADWEATSRQAGDRLVEDFLDWAVAEIRAAEQRVAGRSATAPVQLFHWKGPERWMVKDAVGADDARYVLYDTHLHDMGASLERALFSVKGTSVKVIGPGVGFRWRAADAGGAQSLIKLDEARSEDPAVRDAARQWLIDYNDDDVDVMYAIRERFSAEPGFVPPYSAIAPVEPKGD